MRTNTFLLVASLCFALSQSLLAAVVQSVGVPYDNYGNLRPFSGSPFYIERPRMSAFFLEDFEDHEMNTPGLSATTTNFLVQNDLHTVQTLLNMGQLMFGPPQSVDGDDGLVNGVGLLGDSWLAEGVSLHFAPDAGGRYPNYAGLVITYGREAGGVGQIPALEAYGPAGELIGVATLVDNWFLSDSGVSGDTFLGFYADEGISRLVPTPFFAIEIDHVQYGWNIPEPSTAAALSLVALLVLKPRSRRFH